MTRPTPLKTLGIVGGASDKATEQYYRMLNDGVNARLGGSEIAETLIAGMNFGNIEYFVHSGDWDGCRAYVEDKVDRLIAAGADGIMCASNTLHRVMEPIMETRNVPFLHIAHVTGRAIKRAGLQSVTLLGTKPVMATDHPRKVFENQFGLKVFVPSEAEQAEINRIIFDELCKDIITPESKARYVEIVERLRGEGSEGLILGCTEIFLLIGEGDFPGYPVFDTTRLHVDAGLAFAFGEEIP